MAINVFGTQDKYFTKGKEDCYVYNYATSIDDIKE